MYEQLELYHPLLVQAGTSFLSLIICWVVLWIIFRFLLGLFCSPVIARWTAHGLAIYVILILFIMAALFIMNLISPANQLLVFIGVSLLIINFVVTPLLYWLDKTFAVMEQGQRIPEKVLHFFALIGGGVGDLISQRAFKHKINKRKFQVISSLAFLVYLTASSYWLLNIN